MVPWNTVARPPLASPAWTNTWFLLCSCTRWPNVERSFIWSSVMPYTSRNSCPIERPPALMIFAEARTFLRVSVFDCDPVKTGGVDPCVGNSWNVMESSFCVNEEPVGPGGNIGVPGFGTVRLSVAISPHLLASRSPQDTRENTAFRCQYIPGRNR